MKQEKISLVIGIISIIIGIIIIIYEFELEVRIYGCLATFAGIGLIWLWQDSSRLKK